MKKFLLIVFSGALGTFVGVTHARFRREMRTANARLLVGSSLLRTEHGTIEFVVHGEGTPVLTLHGAGGGYDQGLWIANLALGSGYKVISVSRFGYLRTPIPPNASIRSQAVLYRDLLDHLNVQKVIVLGTSAGGPSAMQFANDYPERTSALILLSAMTRAFIEGDRPFYVGIINLIIRSDYTYWLIAKFMQPVILNLFGIPADVYAGFSPIQKELAEELLETMHPISKRYPGTDNDGKMIQQSPPAIDALSAPTLILHAKDDGLVSYRHAEYARQAISGAQLISFAKGGHGLLSQMDAVRKSVGEFLRGLGIC